MYEEKSSTKDNMEMNKDKNEENRSDGNGKKMDDDELMGSTDAELFKIEEKERESKEDDIEEWTKNNEDSEEESSDNGTGENDTDDRSENSNVSMIDETEENSGEVEEGEWNKIGPNKRKAPNQRKNKN